MRRPCRAAHDLIVRSHLNMTPLVFKIIGYIGWLAATALGIGGSWFWIFTEPDPNDPHRKRLTSAGKRAIYVMAVSVLFAIASTTYSEISSYRSAIKAGAQRRRQDELLSNVVQRDSIAPEIEPGRIWELPRMLPSGSKLEIHGFGVSLIIHGPNELSTKLASAGHQILRDLPAEPTSRRRSVDVSHLIEDDQIRGYLVTEDAEIPIIGRRGALHRIVFLNSMHEVWRGKVYFEWTEKLQ